MFVLYLDFIILLAFAMPLFVFFEVPDDYFALIIDVAFVFWKVALLRFHFVCGALFVHTFICQNGDRGSLSITNLRLIWQSQRSSRTNLSKQRNNGTTIVTTQTLQYFLVNTKNWKSVGIPYCRHRLLHYLKHQNSNCKKSAERKQVTALHPCSIIYINRFSPASYIFRSSHRRFPFELIANVWSSKTEVTNLFCRAVL